MNPILRNLHNKQWIWTAANAKASSEALLSSGFPGLDEYLTGGFPKAGMIHLQSHLGCGELRFILSTLKHNSQGSLYVFINAPFPPNAEFLLTHNIDLNNVVCIQCSSQDESLWCAEQCSKSGACSAIFLWQQSMNPIQIRKLEYAAQQGSTYCVWFDNSTELKSNLPLSLSLQLERENDDLHVRISKQKIGWPSKRAVRIPLPFKSRTRLWAKHALEHTNRANNLVKLRPGS